jgi:mono/diheme cytochrome c family protein
MLAGVLAWLVVAFGAEAPMANPPLGTAARVDYRALGRDADIASLERGRSYYAQLCIACHGARGDGLGEWAYRVHPRPADLRSQRIRNRTDEQLFQVISEGLPGTPMKGWKGRLSEEQVRQVILYVRHLGVIGERT